MSLSRAPSLREITNHNLVLPPEFALPAGVLFALFSGSLSSSSPLKKRVKQYISQKTIDRVAHAGREEHRRLYVGTVNEDTGRLVIWDLTAIAMDASNPNRLDLYRQVVFASASIPILVPPVKIDGNLYADGGARAQLFFEKGFFPVFKNLQQRKELHPNLTIHIIVNGKLGLDEACVRDCLSDIVSRTLNMLLGANEIGDLYHIKYVLSSSGYGRFRLCNIPTNLDITSSEVFGPVKMRALYNAGVQFGKTAAEPRTKTEPKWKDSVPELDLRRH
jgi:hypothetical protein